MKAVKKHTIINIRFIAITAFFIALITALAGCGTASENTASSARAQEDTSVPAYVGSGAESGIAVTGEASAEFFPDIATLNLAVEATRDTVKEASDDVTEVFARMLVALENSGINREEIKADNLRIQPENRYINNELVIIGYKVWRNVTVTVRDLDTVSDVASSVITAGGDEVRFYGVEFNLENPSLKRAELQAQAARDARARAEIYAQALGVTLGPVVYISEQSAPYSPYFARAEGYFARSETFLNDATAAAITDILPGDVTVSVQVWARFAIER